MAKGMIMTKRFLLAPLVMALLGTSQAALAVTNCPQSFNASGTQILNDDWQQTGSGDCFTVNASNFTLDCNNHTITCNHAGGCGAAVALTNSYSNITVRNCYIVSGTGTWAEGVLNGYSTISGVLVTNANTVQHVSVNGATFGVLHASTVRFSIFRNATFCIADYLTTTANNANITSNYCVPTQSGSTGIYINGPSSSGGFGGSPTVQENYVLSSVTGGSGSAVNVSTGFVTLQNNIIDGGGDIVTGTNTTHSNNICSASSTCPDAAPGSSYGTQPDFELTLSSN